MDVFFFFSSRRRHTRSVSAFLLNRSSDLNTTKNINHTRSSISDDIRNILCSSANMRRAIPLILRLLMKIGRASCRERVYISVVEVTLKKKEQNTCQCKHVIEE